MIPPLEIQTLFAPFGLDASKAEFLGHSQNHVYSCPGPGTQQRIVRISEGRRRTDADIEAELEWISMLADRGLRVCQPVRSRSGNRCERLEIGGNCYLVVCFEHAPGRKITREDLTPGLYAELGRLVAQMHLASVEFNASRVRFERADWNESRLLNADVHDHRDRLGANFIQSLGSLRADATAFARAPENFGLIHSDISFGNCFIDDGRLWIFDFDNCEYGFFLQDLATVLYDSIYCKVLHAGKGEDLTARCKLFWDAFISGYAPCGPLRQFSATHLETFFLLREAVIYVHYHRVLDFETLNPTFLEGLNLMRRNVETRTHQISIQMLLGGKCERI